jgi:hypothetical protein
MCLEAGSSRDFVNLLTASVDAKDEGIMKTYPAK